MPYRDIFKRRACHKRYYSRNKRLYYEKNKRRKAELLDFTTSLKQKPCVDCGVQYPHYAMDFDHRDSKTKIETISNMAMHHATSKKKILEEVSKCDLVCANCHRKRTYMRNHCPVG